MQIVVITRAKVIKRKDIIESNAPNKGSNICMIGKWLVMELYSPSSLRGAKRRGNPAKIIKKFCKSEFFTGLLRRITV
ncbi:hypothetical protein H6P87_00394 [Rickettsia tillamookensis]|uniref:Uncharacterized protein n=1 Tax=Rickettsia tillamookensis TaxID=2761623 RepID=A0A9E6MH22_9RICK|nr:hypothetical protein H6P87_00394 [Rickettsia tillamookensis]